MSRPLGVFPRVCIGTIKSKSRPSFAQAVAEAGMGPRGATLPCAGIIRRCESDAARASQEIRSMRAKKKTGPLRARLQFVGAKPTITFQRGTADSLSIAIWEDGQPAAVSACSMPRRISQTIQRVACQPCGVGTEMESCCVKSLRRMGGARPDRARWHSCERAIPINFVPRGEMMGIAHAQARALRPSYEIQKCQRCAFATRKSRNTCTRATDLSSSG